MVTVNRTVEVVVASRSRKPVIFARDLGCWSMPRDSLLSVAPLFSVRSLMTNAGLSAGRCLRANA